MITLTEFSGWVLLLGQVTIIIGVIGYLLTGMRERPTALEFAIGKQPVDMRRTFFHLIMSGTGLCLVAVIVDIIQH